MAVFVSHIVYGEVELTANFNVNVVIFLMMLLYSASKIDVTGILC
ncbi:MAG: hypothetical protein ACI8RD_001777 [Bacillariaceae sp.]|jgi:hypothetical protein